MERFDSYTDAQLKDIKSQLEEKYNSYKEMGLSLNMARGKPCPEQLDISLPLLDCVNSVSGYNDREGLDCLK